LFGLKENVIIGKLIPAGSGFTHGRFSETEDGNLESIVHMDDYPSLATEE
jgi:DNA-directed RNA polymerase subunit beta'